MATDLRRWVRRGRTRSPPTLAPHIAAAALLLVLLPPSATGGVVTTFADDSVAVEAGFAGGGVRDITIRVPSGVLGTASANLTGLPFTTGGTDHPQSPSLRLDGTEFWRFAGNGVGDLGRQALFVDGSPNAPLNLAGNPPGPGTAELLLPAGVDVVSAEVRVRVVATSSPIGWTAPLVLRGGAGGDRFGRSVAGVGDLNGDGRDDFAVGAPGNDTPGAQAGIVGIWFGGAALDSSPDLILQGASSSSFGNSVDGAGDVNNDGYDDLVVGAPWIGNGRASVFLGAAAMDAVADVVLVGTAGGGGFGLSVGGGGDINLDGFDDVVVGSPLEDVGAPNNGRVAVFWGGAPMDTTVDVSILGPGVTDGQFGWSVDIAGDVNGDGSADVVVGNPWMDVNTTEQAGMVRIFFGGSPMDNAPDVSITGASQFNQIGYTVDAAGDVNGDAIDDVIYGDNGRGRAFLLLGGAGIDAVPDRTFTGTPLEAFGVSASGVGDMTGDGIDDLVVGALAADPAGNNSGRVDLYTGSAAIDTVADRSFPGLGAGDYFGWAVAGAGDVDGNGLTALIGGAPFNNSLGNETGIALLYRQSALPNAPALAVAGTKVWSRQFLAAGGSVVVDLADGVRAALPSLPASAPDAWGTRFVTVPLELSAEQNTSFVLESLEIVYANVSVNMTAALKASLAGRGPGPSNVTLRVSFSSPGRFRLDSLALVVDEPPVAGASAAVTIDEESNASGLLDLTSLFGDDFTAAADLRFALVPGNGSSPVAVGLPDGRRLAVDAGAPAAVNWTGEFEVEMTATDVAGQTTRGGPVRITVRNVNDAPVITSLPPTVASPGVEYRYDLTFDDAETPDIDVNVSLLAAPIGMVRSGSRGIGWIPDDAQLGIHGVTVEVNDGTARVEQSFLIEVILPPVDLPPAFDSVPPVRAQVGEPYRYVAHATDPEAAPVTYRLDAAPPGMAVNGTSGEVTWTPTVFGRWETLLAATDGTQRAEQRFNVTAKNPPASDAPPLFTSQPPLTAVVCEIYRYAPQVSDPDDVELRFELMAAPAGMTIDGRTGVVVWTPCTLGRFVVLVAVDDGVSDDFQAFSITVRNVPLDRNNAPVLDRPAPVGWGVGRELRVRLTATDPDGDPLLFRLGTLRPGAAVTEDGLFTWTPDANQSGLNTFLVEVTDGVASDTDVLEVTVTAPVKPSAGIPLTAFIGLAALVALLAAVAAIVAIRRGRRRSEGMDAPESSAVSGPPPTEGAGAAPGASRHQPAGHAPLIGTAGPGAAHPDVLALPPASLAVDAFLIREAFLIYRDGRLIAHTALDADASADSMIVGGMLVAIQAFVREGFRGSGALNTFSFERDTVVIQSGSRVFLAAVVEGTPPPSLRDELQRMVETIEGLYVVVLDSWDGDLAPMVGLTATLEPLLQYHRQFTFRTAAGEVRLRSGLEFFQGYIRLKVAAINETTEPVTEGRLTLVHDQKFLRLARIEPKLPRHGSVVELGVLPAGEKRTVAFYLDPLMCQESTVEASLTYRSGGQIRTVAMKRRPVDIVCPIFYTPQTVNPALLRRLVAHARERDSRVYRIPEGHDLGRAQEIAHGVIRGYDVRFVRQFTEMEPVEVLEGWYYGLVRETGEEITIRVVSRADTRTLQVEVASANLASMTGLLAELGHHLAAAFPDADLVTDEDTRAAVERTTMLLSRYAESELAPGG